jgi:hypothetical protein
MKQTSFAALALCCAMMLMQCGALPNLAGGDTSETGNTFIIGHVSLASGHVASNAQVQLVRNDYNAVRDGRLPSYLIDSTDEIGDYFFKVPDSGTYNIEAVDLSQRTRSLLTNIAVHSDTVVAPDATLRAPGAITVMLPDSVDRNHGYIYIPGTTMAVSLSGSHNSITLDSVPAGVVPEIAYSTTNESTSTPIRYAVSVKSDDSAIIWNCSWNYSQPLFLNTTPSGANISGTVVGFPVLVRLNSENFDFALAKANGADIRFAKADNTFLPYEIERWDPVNRLAEIWVRVDTIKGNSDNQSIVMYWGNANASDASHGPAVFDSADGFGGVWHLNETSGVRASDASFNGFSGIYKGGLPQNATGPLGICQTIVHPDTDYVDMGNVLNMGLKNISIGVWVKRASFGTQQAVISKTNGNGPSATYGYLLSIDLFNYPHFYMASGGVNFGDTGAFDMTGSLTITDSTVWHYVFVSIDRSDNGRCRMYVDGVDRSGTLRGDATGIANVANALRFCIGTQNNNWYSYKGAVSEATIAFTARSADWVKLSYMNQKGQDALVKW